MINRATRTSPSVLREYPGAMQHAAVSSIVRSCIAIARGKLYTAERPAAYVKSRWPGDRTTDLVMRAATAPASPGAAGWAQELAQITTQFLASLVPVSAGANLLARGVQLNLDGAGLISMPLISQSAATFVRAGGSIPVRQFTTSAVGLEPRGLKLAATLTAEMLASSSAEDAARAVLIESAALGVDAALFSASAATPDAPAGLLNGIAATAPSSATLREDAMVEDLAKLAGVVARAAGNEVVLVMAPEQAVAATLRSDQLIFPVLASAALPVKTVIAVAAAGVGSAADAVPQISVGRENALIGDDVPGAGPATLSVFQTDGVAVRMTLPVTWTLRSPGTLAWIDAVTW